MGASATMNLLQRGRLLMVAEGLYLFEARVPAALAGRTIAESAIREHTGCSVVAIRSERGMEVVPSPGETLPADADVVLIGTVEAEARFLERYGKSRAPTRSAAP
jgi:K+/H+ antiporter YhaU regulatory subunit KhtT